MLRTNILIQRKETNVEDEKPWGEDDANRTKEGIVIEWIQNAQINFLNLKRMGVVHPILDMALEQLANGLGKNSVADI